MVQGVSINKQNYSVDQLKELKNAGVQGISDDDIKMAEQREAQNAKESDEANVSYQISDDASEVNEAQKEVDTAKEYGANLKTILENLTPKCQNKDGEMQKLQEEMSQFEVQMEDLFGQAEALTAETTEQAEEIQTEADAKNAELEAKQEEIEETTKELDTAVEEAETSENADTGAIDKAQGKIESLSAEAKDISGDIEALEAKIQGQIKEAALTKAALLGETMEGVKDKAQASLNDAINANEYADVTIDQGTQASNIGSKKEAKAAGFTKRVLFWKKGDVGKAHRAGDFAIAMGEQLGNSSQGVAKTVKTVAGQYQMGFAETSGIDGILNKQYVDTSKLSDMQDLGQVKGLGNTIKAMRANSGIIHDIAEASKNKGTQAAAEEEAKKKQVE